MSPRTTITRLVVFARLRSLDRRIKERRKQRAAVEVERRERDRRRG